MSVSTPFGWSARRHPQVIQIHRSWGAQSLLIVWWWLFEIALITGLVVGYLKLTSYMPGWAAATAIIAPVGLALSVSPTRRHLVGWSWCTITRHRLRSFFTAVRLTNGKGRLPWLLFIYPTATGERALCLMVAGLSFADLTHRNEAIAAACWAREARATRSNLGASLVWINVVRRDPPIDGKPAGSVSTILARLVRGRPFTPVPVERWTRPTATLRRPAASGTRP